jgi:hypothetical protein
VAFDGKLFDKFGTIFDNRDGLAGGRPLGGPNGKAR